MLWEKQEEDNQNYDNRLLNTFHVHVTFENRTSTASFIEFLLLI